MSDPITTTSDFKPPPDPFQGAPGRVQLDVQARVVFKVLLIAALFLLAVNVVQQLTSLIVQIAIAAFLAVAADPVVRRLQRAGLGRGRAVLLILLTVLVALALVIAVLVPPLAEQGNNLVEAAPGIVHDVQRTDTYRRVDKQFGIVQTLSDQAAALPSKVGDQLGAVFGAVAAALFGTLTIIFLTVFLLLGGGSVMRGTVQIFPLLTERRWWSIIDGAYTGIASYVGGAIVIATIGGTVMTLSALSLGLPYALPLGLWMALLEIIPLIGATIGAIPGIIVAFVAGGVVEGVIMIGIVVAYQQVENIIIQPRVQGRAASLSPFVVFVAVLAGSQLLGVLGALFAVPVAGVIQIFLKQIIEERGDGDLSVPSIAGHDATPLPDDGDSPELHERGEAAQDPLGDA